MRVAVTGGAGFIGSWVCDALAKRGYEVRVIDNMSGGYLSNVCFNDLRVCNVLDLGVVTIALRGCDAVIHCAALAAEGLSVFSPSAVVQSVVMGSVNVAVAAARVGIKRFINLSSAARYGLAIPSLQGRRGTVDEESTPLPVDPYGISKLAAESLLDSLGNVHGFRVVHILPHNVIGPRQRYDDPYRNVVSIFANRMLQGQPPIIYGDGLQRRCFSDVRDVVPCIVTTLEGGRPHGELFNIGPDGDGTTVADLARMVATECGYSGEFTFVPSRPCEVEVVNPSSRKARAVLGFKDTIPLEQSIHDVVEWIRQRGPKPFVYDQKLEIERGAPSVWKEGLL